VVHGWTIACSCQLNAFPAVCRECIQLVNELELPVEVIMLPSFAYEHKVFVGPFSRRYPKAQVGWPCRAKQPTVKPAACYPACCRPACLSFSQGLRVSFRPAHNQGVSFLRIVR
jgi:Domain of unknown function (DUF4336)